MIYFYNFSYLKLMFILLIKIIVIYVIFFIYKSENISLKNTFENLFNF